MYDLCTIDAIAPDGYHFTREEWVIYSQGYYFAIARAVKVMDMALVRWKMYRRSRHVETKARNRAAREAEQGRSEC